MESNTVTVRYKTKASDMVILGIAVAAVTYVGCTIGERLARRRNAKKGW